MNEQHQNDKLNDEEKPQENHYLIPSRKRLYRSPNNSILLGISGGIAGYMNFNPILVRAIFILTAIMGGWGIIAYIICAFLIPAHPSQKENDLFGRINSTKLLGLIFIGIGVYYWLPVFGIFRFFDFFNFNDSIMLAVLLIFGGFYILLRVKVNRNKNKTYRPKKLFRARKQRRLLGICEGLSIYIDTDVNIIRMLWVLLTFITLGLTAVFYLAIGYFIPNENEDAAIYE